VATFSVRVMRRDTTTVVEFAGDLDYERRQAIAAAITDALAAPCAELVIDLEAVTFIDSIGVEAAIMSPARAANTLAMAFRVEPGVTVRQLVGQMGLEDLLHRSHNSGTR
jgi:anti-anti-sigma factor